MKNRIRNQFIINYILMFIMSLFIGSFTFMLMDFAGDVISKTLIKNKYTAESIMKDDYHAIDTALIVQNGGGVQVVEENHRIILSEGINTFRGNKLTVQEFTDFLINSKSKGIPFSYSIKYNQREKFWLIVTFPTSIRIDFAIVRNKDFHSIDTQNVLGVVVAVTLFYLLSLGIVTAIYSKITSLSIVNPLKKLSKSAQKLGDGDYTARVDLNLSNEFGELESIFNTMAKKIEEEMTLRKQSEESRKRLIMDISHDLKNPLASIMGYSERCLNKSDLPEEEIRKYLKVIYDNSIKTNYLINNLFHLSKMEDSKFILNKSETELCEFVRDEMGKQLPVLDDAGFQYEFEIPDEECFVFLDKDQMGIMFQNLVANTVKYNQRGTEVFVSVCQYNTEAVIIFRDNGIGIPKELAKDIFQPFVRTDSARNSETGGTGLGLAIVKKVIEAHSGSISLKTDIDSGCEFLIRLPKI